MHRGGKEFSGLGRLDSAISVCQWIWDKASTFVGAATGASMMGYLATVTVWLDRWGPVAWGAIALVTFLVLLLGISGAKRILAESRLRRARAAHAEKLVSATNINPLEPRFVGNRLAIADLMSPFGEPISNRTFEGCELIGPSAVVFSGCTFDGNRADFHAAEWVKIKGERFSKEPNKAVFVKCRFIDCVFYSILGLVPETKADDFESNGIVTWLN